MNILFIGAGRMAEAIISGLAKHEEVSITVSNKVDSNKLAYLKDKYNVDTTSNWKQEVKNNDAIMLAAPPSAHEELFEQLAPLITQQLILTVAAGVDPTYMESKLPDNTPVCWIMPNTAAQLEKSISTFTCGKHATKQHRDMIKMILTSIGNYEELSEQQVHNLTAITGSAPAFLYLFTEALEEAAMDYGVSPAQARKLVTQMIAGSAAMLEAGYSPEELREQVATPGGSTAAGLNILNNGQFKELLNKAVIATNEHARSKSN